MGDEEFRQQQAVRSPPERDLTGDMIAQERKGNPEDNHDMA